MRWYSVLLLLPVGCPTFSGTGDKDPTTFGGDDDDDNAGDDDDNTDSTDNVGDDDDDNTTPGDDDDVTVDCGDGPDPTGPWPEHPISEAGAPITRDPYTVDAGIADLLAAAEGQFEDVPVNIVIDGAIVTSRGYVPANPTMNTVAFWFEDSNGPMYAHFTCDIGQDPNNLQPGDEIRFTATAVQEFFGTPQVSTLTDFEIVSTGNPVHVVDGMSGDPITFDTHGMYTVEVWGGLVSGPEDCAANCFDMDYGAGIVTYRTDSTYDVVGDCLHFIGPVGQFDGDPQLNVDDFDWAWRF